MEGLEEDPPRWPLHERLLGVAGRAGLATLGLIPIVVYAVANEGLRGGMILALLGTFVVFFGAAAVILVVEHRGGRWWATPLRLAAAGAAATLILPLPVFWVLTIVDTGDPMAAWNKLQREVRPEVIVGFLFGALGAGLLTPLMGLLIYVRNQTERVLPQVLAGVVTLAWPIFLLLTDSSSRDQTLGFFLLVTAVTVPLTLALGDRVMRGRDPLAPRPPADGNPRLAFAIAAPLVLVVPAFFMGNRGFYGWYDDDWGHAPARRTLQTLTHLQQQHRARNQTRAPAMPAPPGKPPTGAPQPAPEPLEPAAGSFSEFAESYAADRPLAQGVKHGYVYRLTACPTDPARWMATADPLRPEFGTRHYVLDHRGRLHVSEGPVPLDPQTCTWSP